MPSINLRLTDSQHADLERWATDGHRSLQKEIIWRLFAQSHFATAVEQVEKRVTEEVRLATGLKDVVATYETEPIVVTPTPRMKKRLHPCRHHVPPSRHCDYCDVA